MELNTDGKHLNFTEYEKVEQESDNDIIEDIIIE